ncbi:hypothetical protein GYH73_029635 [Bacillus megaterium]|nr:hypothetical protein [Priestia megaterium]
MVDLEQIRNFNLTNEKVIELRANFINNFGEAIMLNLDQNTSFDRILKWGKESGELASNLGVSLSEALETTSYYRKFIWEVLKEEIKTQHADRHCI